MKSIVAAEKKVMVVGFCFTKVHFDRWGVVLIRKNKPDWQKGKLNGVGGKVEIGENPEDAMAREWFEETHVNVPNLEWRPFCQIKNGNDLIYFYSAYSTVLFTLPKMKEGEEQATWYEISTISNQPVDFNVTLQMISNLKYLIPLALDWQATAKLIDRRDYTQAQ